MRERPEEFVSRYGISARNGFLPDAAPLSRLPDPYYAPWEELIQNLPDLLSTSQLKSKVDCLPVLDVTRLELDAEWQRAYVILGFLTHAYIWGGEQPSEVCTRDTPMYWRPLTVNFRYFPLKSRVPFWRLLNISAYHPRQPMAL